jgi:hypothetical protein
MGSSPGASRPRRKGRRLTGDVAGDVPSRISATVRPFTSALEDGEVVFKFRGPNLKIPAPEG